MEHLKPLEALLVPDDRQAQFAVRNSVDGTFRPIAVGDIYERASTIKLHEGVPEDVRSHFATALNLLAYSWYFYPFNVTAQFMAYVSVESALRVRLSVTKYTPFKQLVERAVREGLVSDSGFAHTAAAQRHRLPAELLRIR